MTAIARVPGGEATRAAAADGVNVVPNQWVAVGPAAVVRGSGTGLPRIAGRVVALQVSSDGVRVYAGTSLGGVWYSSDEGAHWIALDFYSSTKDAADVLQHADALTVGALAVRFGATAADDVVYVGAGEHPTFGVEAPSATLAAVGIRRALGPVNAVAPAAAPFAGAAAADPWRVEATALAGLAVNKFAFDRTDGIVWAATSRGLYRRVVVPAVDWVFVDTGLGNGEMSDVVAMSGLGAEPQRIYVAALGGSVAFTADDGAHWQVVNPPAFPAATPIVRVQLAGGNVPGHAIVYALADGPRLWRIDDNAAQAVSGLPADIVNEDPETLKPFKLAIAVHPANDAPHRDTIAVGGQTFRFPNVGRRQAALFLGQVTLAGGTWTVHAVVAAPAPPQWIGSGMPPGVQTIAWVQPPMPPAAPAHLWVGGDGGIFRSTSNGDSGSFQERNTGLGAFDVTTFAQARDADSIMIAATRSNGLLRRQSDETWTVAFHGPVGGVAVDPADARRMYAQVSRSAWRFTKDGGATPFTDLSYQSPTPVGLAPAEQNRWDNARDNERVRSALVSRMGLFALAGSRRGTQRALGTYRVWYTDDERQFEAQRPGGALSGWVTLPSLTDPYNSATAGAPLTDKDKLDGPVLALQWGAENRLYALTEKSVYFFERNDDLTWKDPAHLYDGLALEQRHKRKDLEGQIPPDLPRLALAVHRATAGKGNLFVGTSGAPDKHHVWWYDGDGHWRDTGFAVDTPVHAIAVDLDHPEVVYLGTERGVYKGTGHNFPVDGNNKPTAGGNPNWDWGVLYSDGLPGAPCVDLAIYSPPGSPQRLLRAALAGRGIWEVLLDGVQQAAEIYVRSHAYDTRRIDAPRGGARDPFGETGGQVALDASPDIRVWRAVGTTPPEAITYPVNAASHAWEIWRLLSALRALGEDVDPEQGWDPVQTPAAVARQQAALFPGAPPADAKALWDRMLQDNRVPHDRTPADHADLVAYVRDEPDRWPKGFRASSASGDAATIVSVTVHSRRWRPVAANTVAITLLRTPYARRHSLEGTAPLPAGWGAHLFADKAIPAAAWNPVASQAWLTAVDWAYADPITPFRPLAAAVDPLNPQVVTFNVTLSGTDTWNKPGWLLVAVVLVDGDILPLGTDVAELVRTDRRIAARSLRRALLPARPIPPADRLAGLDQKVYPTANRMNSMWSESNVVWTGFYFNQVTRPPYENAEAQGTSPYTSPHFTSGEFIVPGAGPNPAPNVLAPNYRGHVDATWMPQWGTIFPDFGAAPIYFGHQDPHNVDWEAAVVGGPNPHPAGWRAKGPFDLREVIALHNAGDAEAKATPPNSSVPKGAVIYLDWERPDLNWVLQTVPPGAVPVASATIYCVTFLRAIAEHGYRPGLYCRPAVSAILRGEVPGVFVWNAQTFNPPPNPLIAQLPKNGGTQALIDTTVPLAEIAPHTVARQWRLDLIPANLVPAVAHPMFTPNTGVDLDVSTVFDPAFPEHRMLTSQIVGGRIAAASLGAGLCAIYTVRRGRPARASGALNALVRDPDAELVAADVKYYWNPYSYPAAVRAPGPAADPDPTDVLLALAYAEAEGDEVWRLQALRHRVTAAGAPRAPWVIETLPDEGLVIDPLAGIAAVSRGDPSIDVFAVVNPTVKFDVDGTLTVARRHKDTFVWSALAAIAGATARRTNRPTAVSRDTGIAAAFWVDAGGRLTTSESLAANPETWSAPLPIGDPAVQIHPFSNLAVVAQDANRIDVLFLGRVPPGVAPVPPVVSVWRIYNVWWTAAGGWGGGANSRVADDGTVTIESLSAIAACRRDATHLDVFTIGIDGALYVTTLDYANAAAPWSGPVIIGVAPAGMDRLSSVDSAVSDGAGNVQVIVTSRDGNVWATSRAGAGAYTPLARVAVLPL